jgi:hypothetical protein
MRLFDKTKQNEELYFEHVINFFSDEFYEANEAKIIEINGQVNNWIIRLWDKGKFSKHAAQIIERAFKIYKI